MLESTSLGTPSSSWIARYKDIPFFLMGNLKRHGSLKCQFVFLQEEPLVRAEIPETYKVPLVGSSSNSCIAAAPATRGPYLNVNTQLANSLSTSPLSPAYMPGTPVYTPSLARWVLESMQASFSMFYTSGQTLHGINKPPCRLACRHHLLHLHPLQSQDLLASLQTIPSSKTMPCSSFRT